MRLKLPRRLMVASFALAIGLAGCASGGGGDGGGTGVSGTGGPNRINAAGLETVVQLDAYQAIQRLRPRWLQSRGTIFANVFIDGSERQGGLEALKGLPVADISDIRFLSASDATTRYGTGHEGGVILIASKR